MHIEKPHIEKVCPVMSYFESSFTYIRLSNQVSYSRYFLYNCRYEKSIFLGEWPFGFSSSFIACSVCSVFCVTSEGDRWMKGRAKRNLLCKKPAGQVKFLCVGLSDLANSSFSFTRSHENWRGYRCYSLPLVTIFFVIVSPGASQKPFKLNNSGERENWGSKKMFN